MEEYAFLLSIETETEMAFMGIFEDMLPIMRKTGYTEWIKIDQYHLIPSAKPRNGLGYVVHVLPLNWIAEAPDDSGQ